MLRRQDFPFADRNTAVTHSGDRITTTRLAAAVARGRRPAAATHPPLPPAGKVTRCVGGAAAAADGHSSDGRPSAA